MLYCSGPPEKKMGIKASNTAEVRTAVRIFTLWSE